MFDIGLPFRKTLFCATVLSGIPSFGLGQAWAGVPFGVYLFVDTKVSSETSLIGTASAIAPLFGTLACATHPCSGGVTGLFLSVRWHDFETAPTSNGTTTLQLDPSNHLSTLLGNIHGIESAKSPFAFQLSLGLKPGEESAFDVLDMYAATGGSFPGQTPPRLQATNVTFNTLHCPFVTNAGTISASGGLLLLSGFPQQCVMGSIGGGPACIAQPRMWGNDASSLTANPLYIKAFLQAQQDLVNFVGGVSNYQTATSHDFQTLKLSGIDDTDAEISIAGNPKVLMPHSGTGTSTVFYQCGNPTARDAEEIWTYQAASGTLAYETSILESTWGSLIAGSIGVTKAAGYSGSIGYVIDTLGDANFPPVQPESCSTNCSYTLASSSLIPQLTTGEMEHLITNALGSSLLSAGNLSIQNEGLQTAQPSSTTEPEYHITEIPCAVNALEGTAIGYQSGGVTLVSGQDKLNYLAMISNAVAYGAQYVELRPSNLGSFVANHTAVAFDGNPTYGTTDQQNIDMLSTTIQSALSVMATNQANSASGTLCPLQVAPVDPPGGTVTIGWDYPY